MLKDKEILRISIPAIATNITVPLLSLVDIAFAGRFGTNGLAAVSVGGAIINLLYWNFGFLRMSTSGLTAQAFGAKDDSETVNLLLRSLFVSVAAAALIILFKDGILKLALLFMKIDSGCENYILTYTGICIVGAPAVMCMYSIKGWFIGMQNTLFPMIIAISVNIINIVCSYVFVFHLQFGIKGIAMGTIISQYFGIILAIILWRKRYAKYLLFIDRHKILDKSRLKRFFSLNILIAIRTFCLTTVTTFFTLAGAKIGPMQVAVNSILLQFFSIFSYFTDGFAYAGEALAGKHIGARDRQSLDLSVRRIFVWGISLTITFTILFYFASDVFVSLMTTDTEIISELQFYRLWIYAIPVCGFAAFLWDGIMIGTTMARGMVYSIIIATIAFFTIYFLCIGTMGNNGLWLAFIIYLALRGIVQTIYYRKQIDNFFVQFTTG